jgi:hypothetical protein
MLVLGSYYDYNNWDKSPCPLGNHSGAGLCGSPNNCGYAQDPGAQYGAPSMADTIGMLLALSVIYLLLAAYWATVFCGGNGAGKRFYFFLLPSYWCTSSSTEVHEDEDETGVTISGLKKTYGGFEALKGVSFQLKAGEVTALLGK